MPLASAPALQEPIPDPKRTSRRIRPSEEVRLPDLFISTTANPTDPRHTAEEDRKVLVDQELYDRERRFYENNSDFSADVVFPEPDQIQENLKRLAGRLNELRSRIEHTVFQINSGFRAPRHHFDVSDIPNSYHQAGLAADIKIGLGGRWLTGSEIADKVHASGVQFGKSVLGNRYPNRAHLAICRQGEDCSGTTKSEFVPDGTFQNQGGDYHSSAPDPEEAAPEDINASADFNTSSISDELLQQLGVNAEEHETTEDGGFQPLADYPDPEEGEMDIGDLRFGSVKFDEIDPSDLNQPSSINQQNAGTIAQVPMLRTDMNPVLQDNSALPETVVTLSLNASERDDINNRLRPLVAMHRRMPFCAVRNPDLARMFLGIGTSGSTVDRLSKLFPSMSDQEARERAQEIDEVSPGSVWVPVTMRALSVQSQPGAPDLYQVHLVLRYANHQPYVPRLQFWKSTEEAAKWARYLSMRSQQGTTVIETDMAGPSGTAKIEDRSGNVVKAEPPVAGTGSGEEKTSHQTLSPHKSYPFKKFYRGLLEEYQPESVGGTEEQLAQAAPLGKKGPGTATADSDDIYEPAYPIKDPARLFEQSDPNADIGLRYRLVARGTSRDARRRRLAQAFEEQMNFADRLDAAAQLLKTNQGLADMKEIGKISPYVIGPGAKVGAALLGFSTTTDALSDAVADASAELKQNQENLQEEISSFKYDPDAEENVAEGATDLTLTGDLDRDIVRQSQFINDGGMVEFGIPSPEYQDIFIPFTDQIRKLQLGVIKTYAKILGHLDDIDPDGWQSFKDRQRFEYAETRGIVDDLSVEEFLSGDTDQFEFLENGSLVPPEEFERGFRSYMLSYQFIKPLAEQTWLREPEPITAPGSNVPVHRKLENLSTATSELSASIYDSLESNQNAIAQSVRGGESDDRRGFLDLSRSTIESVQMRFTNRFGDKEWDAYPNAVSQHIGGGNAEVTLEIATDDQLLLDQLGQIKRSQEAMSQLRETQDMVPALIDVFGEGNFLRAHGIKRLAYRSHTVTMAENQPGTYQVRLDLIQDEATLKRAEKFRKVTSTSERFKPGPAEPLVEPRWAIGEDAFRQSLLENTGADHRPAPVASLLGQTYRDLPFTDFPDDLETQIAGSIKPDSEDDPAFPTDVGSDPGERSQLLPKSFYHGLEGLPDFFGLTQEARPIIVSCEYVLPEDRDSPNRGFFECDLTLRDPETGDRFRKTESFDLFLRPIGRYLDYARSQMDDGQFRQLVQAVNDTLSTKGSTQKGLVLSWIDLAIGKLNEARSRGADEGELTSIGSTAVGAGPSVSSEPGAGEFLSPVPDNLTLTAEKAINNNLESATLATAARPFLQAADELSRTIADMDAAREAYRKFVDRQEYDGWKDLKEGISDIHGKLEAAAASVPSAYPDLLMREVEDPDQSVNVLAPDFPFGPGVADMAEDRYLEDYEFADSMRRVTTFKMASIGLNALDPYIEAGVPEEDQETSPRESLSGEEALGFTSGTREAAPENTSYERVRAENTKVLQKAFNTAVQDIKQEVEGGAEVPFSTDGDHFSKMMTELEKKAAFRPTVDKQLTAQDRVNVLRVSRTARYVTEVIEAARQANRRDMANPFTQLDPSIQGDVEKAVKALKEGNESFFGPVSKTNAARQAQNITDVQEDPWIMRRRKEIIDLYNADPSAIADQFGWNDRTAEPRRQKLMEQLRESWTDWKGMREAFPSYQLLVAGPVGSGSWETLDKLYTWTALQSLTVRDMQDNAGTYAELTLSNMRQRVMGPNGTQGSSPFREEEYDTRLKVEPGTNMYVYYGYGPDVAHLRPFAGRVTSMRPGPQFAIELSSYGTTLNYPPNEGKGFYVDGSDGQATIAEAVLYTIGQTEGLEGLGSHTIGSPVDPLGRDSEGNAENAWRTTLATSVYRSIGSPGLGAALGDETQEAQAVQNVLDYAAENGAQSLKQFLLGDPAVYENVWLSSAQTQATFSDVLFGGAKDLYTQGKGWGWASRPNQTAWSQLRAQSKLFPDYAVTTRPYNADVPLEDQVQGDDLRETLYFGPRDGSYIHSASAEKGTGTFSRLSDEMIREIIEENYETEPEAGARFGEQQTVFEEDQTRFGASEQMEKILELYKDLYVRTAAALARQRLESSGEPGFVDLGVAETLDFAFGGASDFFGGSRFDVTERFKGLAERNAGSDVIEAIENALAQVFPQTSAVINRLQRGSGAEAKLFRKTVGSAQNTAGGSSLGTPYARAVLPYSLEQTTALVEPNEGVKTELETFIDNNEDRASSAHGDIQSAVMEAFIEDLRHLATQGQGAQNLTRNPLLSNPIVAKIRQKLLGNGYVPGNRFKPVQKHHFANTYEKVVNNQVRASSNNPEFFNRVTVSWPEEPDKRMSAYLGGTGSRMSYQVQAAPTISEDFIQDRTVYYPNLSYDQAEVTRLVTSQFEKVDGGGHFEELIKRLETLNEDVKDDKTSVAHDPNNPHKHGQGVGPQTPINEAMEDVQKEIRRILDELNEIYVRPKFQTVANNYLLEGLREMYSGQMVMKGSPDIRPYHVMHLFDDVKQMHGPTEAKAVMHHFDQDGFYTVVEPQLTARLRGTGSASDVSWMAFASQYSSFYTWWQRLGSGLMSAGAVGSRVGMYATVGSWLISSGSNLLASAGLRASAYTVSGALPFMYPLIAADILYSVLSGAASAGRENAKQYIGLVTGAMDANPVMMIPLTYKGQSFTAGLTGATGPGSLQTALEEDLNRAAESGGMGLDVLTKIRKYSNLEAQAPQQGPQ